MNNRILEGEVVLVTGASRGIGRAIAAACAVAGARVIGTATSQAGVDSINRAFAEFDTPGVAFILDVADPGSVDDLGTTLAGSDQVPTILVNNAGITRDNLLLRMKDDEWESVINTNLNSIFRLTRLCLRGMMKARHGRIINMTSVVAFSGSAGQVNYAAAKAGIVGFTRSLAREVGSRGITVNAVAPGLIATDMTAGLPDAYRQELVNSISVGRLGTAEEIAAVVVFLASASAAYITGETIHVNGGMYMG